MRVTIGPAGRGSNGRASQQVLGMKSQVRRSALQPLIIAVVPVPMAFAVTARGRASSEAKFASANWVCVA